MRIAGTRFTPVQIGIAVLTLLTAAIHIWLAEPLFILNGLGYLALWAALYLPITALVRYRGALRWLFVGYILVTTVGYFLLHPNGIWQTDAVGLATKMIEVMLLLLVVYDGMEGQAQA